MWRSGSRGGGPVRAHRLAVTVMTALAMLAAVSLLPPTSLALAEGTAPAPAEPAAADSLAAASAAPPATFDTLEVTLMPEYDTPSPEVLGDLKGALVYRGGAPVTGLDVAVRMPEGSQVYSVCEAGYLPGQPEHNPMAADRVTIRDGEGYREVLWKVDRTLQPGETYTFHVEFYFNGVSGGPDKTVRYTLLPTYDSTALQVTIAEPKGTTAGSYRTELGDGTRTNGGDGLTYHGYALPGVKAGEPLEIAFSYTRPSNDPSFTPAEVSGQGSAGQNGGTPAGGNTTALIVGLGVLAGLAGLFFVSNRPRQAPASRQQRRAALHQAAKAQARAQGRPQAGTQAKMPSRSLAETPPQSPAPRVRPAPTPAPGPAPADPRLQARKLLEEGRITEEAYRVIIAELDVEEGRRQA